MRDSASLRKLLADAVEQVRSTDSQKFIDAAREVCKIGRSLNFALAEEWCPDPPTLAIIADELASAGNLVLTQIELIDGLTDTDTTLAKRVAEHVFARAEDVRGYGAAALAAGSNASMAL